MFLPCALGHALDPEDELVEYELLLFEEEEVVSAATRKVQKLSEAPGTVRVIQAEELEVLGILTLQDALRYVTSIALVPQNASIGAEIRGIRQPFANKVLVLRDGRVLNSVFRGEAHVDLRQPIEDLERIEIIRGPGSALYGANAFAGFVNLVTRTGEQSWGTHVRGGVDADGLGYLHAAWGSEREDGELHVRARILRAEPADLVSGGDGGHADASIDVTWLNDDTRFEFGVHGFESDESGTFDLPRAGSETEKRGVHVDFSRTWKWGVDRKGRLRTYAAHEEGTYRDEIQLANLQTIEPRWINGNALFITDITGEVLDEPTRTFLDGAARAGAGDLYLDLPSYEGLLDGTLPTAVTAQDSRERTIFAEYQFDWEISERHYFLAGASAKVDLLTHDTVGDFTFSNVAAFVEHEWRPVKDRLIVLGSARFDRHGRFGNSFSPRVAVIGVIHPKVALKGSFGTAFRSPNFVELFADSRNGLLSISGNPDLDQESITTRELQLDLRLGSKHDLSLIGFDYDIDDEVVFRIDRRDIYLHTLWSELNPRRPPVLILAQLDEFQDARASATFINARDTSGRGLELTLHGRPHERFSYRVNYSRVDLELPVGEELVETGNRIDPDSGDVLPGPVEPHHIPELKPSLLFESFTREQAAASLVYRPTDRWSLSARTAFVSARDRSILDSGTSRTFDFTASVRFGSFDVSATVLNAFGDDWLRSPDGLAGSESRSFLVLLRHRRGARP